MVTVRVKDAANGMNFAGFEVPAGAVYTLAINRERSGDVYIGVPGVGSVKLTGERHDCMLIEVCNTL